MNRKRFAETMLILGVAFDAEVSETRITIYFEALLDFPEDAVLRAMRETIKRCKFFPRVSEIRELVAEGDRQRRERERTTRIAEESRRRRLEVAEWEKDRASRALGSTSTPMHIGALLPHVLEEVEEP